MARRITAEELASKAEARRLKHNADLRAWRKKNPQRVSNYMREWRAKRKADVEAAKAIVAAAEARKRTTTIEIDVAKFEEVRRELGTRTLRETVDRAFDEVLRRVAAEESIERLQKMKGLDLDKPEVMARAWR